MFNPNSTKSEGSPVGVFVAILRQLSLPTPGCGNALLLYNTLNIPQPHVCLGSLPTSRPAASSSRCEELQAWATTAIARRMDQKNSQTPQKLALTKKLSHLLSEFCSFIAPGPRRELRRELLCPGPDVAPAVLCKKRLRVTAIAERSAQVGQKLLSLKL